MCKFRTASVLLVLSRANSKLTEPSNTYLCRTVVLQLSTLWASYILKLVILLIGGMWNYQLKQSTFIPSLHLGVGHLPDVFDDRTRRDKTCGRIALTAERRCSYWVSVRKPLRKRSLGILRRRWEGNIKMGLQVIRWEEFGVMYLGKGTFDGLL
jgi:hypothetical protein